jgi:hypothetical protein
MEELIDFSTDFGKLVHRMNRSYGCFFLWKYIRKSISIPEVGQKEVERRKHIMDNYNGIFSGFFYAVETTFIIDLHKFFDKSKKNLTIKTLVKKLSEDDKIKVEALVSSVEKEVERIKTLRHNNFAHEPITPEEEKIFMQEIEKIFGVVQKILNIIGKSTGNPNIVWNDWEETTNQAFSRLLNDLEYGYKIFESKKL